MNDEQILAAARRGDERAFADLVEPYRSPLQAHCYRMLGSRTDAEEALQETMLGAWRGIGRFEGRSSLRSWLYTIATNTCLRAIERRPKRVLPIDYGPAADPHDEPRGPLVESIWIDPIPDAEVESGSASPDARYEALESVELAFIAAMQHLPARQRAILILRDVLGFSARETGEALGTTSVSVDSALQRAHKTVDARLPERSQQATLRALDNADLKRVVEGYVQAWERKDIEAMVSMLAEDAVLAMPPEPQWFAGRDAVGTFLGRFPFGSGTRVRMLPTRVNGQLAFGHYVWNDAAGAYLPGELSVLTLRGREIAELIAFRTPASFAGLELPSAI
ncbi:MAG TPA: sigma-70 family RNA polymerase sigma factor [Solirubrobacterales bacterium]|nr:sigma-70 family RNA polymerase sigma factor [Solirubrobacterales bacterium]